MYIFTFSYSSQWMDGFYQVIANDENRAVTLIGHDHKAGLSLVSCFIASLGDEERIVYSREIDNPSYEG